jgi:predicted RNA-binding protein YlxR (DUF448 family)
MLAQAQDDGLDPGPRKVAPGSERFCAATGAAKPVSEMIRFVLGPDGAVVPDLKRRLPGRGIWITATREALSAAVARKAFARSFKREVRVQPDFVAATERLIEKSALDALGMARKAGKVAIGFAKAEAALGEGGAVALVEASDGAADGARKLAAVARREAGAEAGHLTVIDAFSSAQLDLALGRSNVVHAALLAGPESDTFLVRARRLARFRDGDQGPSRGRRKPGEQTGRIGI